MFAIKLFLAGLWPLVWHWGTPVAIIILCLIGEFVIGWFASSVPFIEKWLKPLQVDLLWIAAAAGIYLWAFSTGIQVENARTKAQSATVTRQIDRVVDEVLKAPENQPKPDVKGQKRYLPVDRWDRKDN